jgi:hypothetical protein
MDFAGIEDEDAKYTAYVWTYIMTFFIGIVQVLVGMVQLNLCKIWFQQLMLWILPDLVTQLGLPALVSWDLIPLLMYPFVGWGYFISSLMNYYFAFSHLLWFDLILFLPYYSIDIGVMIELGLAVISSF